MVSYLFIRCKNFFFNWPSMINVFNFGLESDRVEVCSIEPATLFWISKELRNISRRKCENKFLIFVQSQNNSQTSPNIIQELALVQSTDYGTNYRHFKCPFCLKVLEKPDVLISHEGVHTDYRPHGCDIRGKTFAAKDSISVHMQKAGLMDAILRQIF